MAAKHPPSDDAFRPPPGTPWFTAVRSEEAWELMLANRNAFILAYVIAYRARWKDGFNRHGLDKGEAMLGDFEAYAMTEQEYRTAKEKLAKWGFATFRATSKGTIASLIGTRLFSLLPPERNDHDNRQPTDKQRTPNEYRKNGKSSKTAKRGCSESFCKPLMDSQ
jgi:hypothetical protein